jgi:hypothetical protein
MRHARPPVNNHEKTPAATPLDGPRGRARTVEGLVIQGAEPGPQRPAGRFIQCLLATSIAYTQTSRPGRSRKRDAVTARTGCASDRGDVRDGPVLADGAAAGVVHELAGAHLDPLVTVQDEGLGEPTAVCRSITSVADCERLVTWKLPLEVTPRMIP